VKEDYATQCVMKDLVKYSQIYLVPLADFHEGSRDADHEVSDGYIEWIREHDNAFTILNGDMMNCATKDSTPELYEDLITPDKAYENLRKRLLPIKDKILMITRGGHEETIFRKVGVDFMARLAYDLGELPYKPDGGLLGIRLGVTGTTGLCWIYATHGWGGARTIGAKIKKVEDLATVANADIIVLSHDHTQAIHRLNIIDPPHSHIQFKVPVHWGIMRQVLVNTGGFVKYAGYIQRKGYAPQDLGTPRIRIELKHNHAETHLDLHASI
jgi:hypothetical protein